MAKAVRSSERRSDALTRERIVDAAIDLLDADGESGLTFRALAARLETGHGAIQWHVANKSELLKAATSVVLDAVMKEIEADASPRDAIRAVALGVFEAIEAHPWIGGQTQGTLMKVFEHLGRQVQALGVRPGAQFTATSTLLIHIVGSGRQEATNSRSPQAQGDRNDFLDEQARHWESLDADEFAFTRSMGKHLREHDDRAVFLAGIDIVIAGMIASR